MKTKLKQKSKLLIKLHLLKSQMYKNNFNISFNNINIELKQALKIIYLYKNKKILFIGFPFNIKTQNQLNQNFMSKIILNKKLQNNELNSYVENKKIDLIVFSQTLKNDFNTIEELKKFNIPLILFGNFDTNKFVQNYIINYSLKKNYIKKFCWFLIFSILTKTK